MVYSLPVKAKSPKEAVPPSLDSTHHTDHPSTLPPFIARYLTGTSLQVIAKEEHVSREAIRKRIYRWTLTGQGDVNYADLVTEALVNRIADADTALDDATEMVGIARARETARFSRMDFERRRPHLYGPHQDSSDSVTIKIPARLLGNLRAAVVAKVIPVKSTPSTQGSGNTLTTGLPLEDTQLLENMDESE